MAYSFQTFSVLEVLGAAKMNQIEVNIRDHVHGKSGVGTSTGATCMTAYLEASMEDGWRGVYRAGFDWWSRNQQWGGPWGGEMLDSATGTLYRTEFATGYIDDNSTQNIGALAANTWGGQGFKVPETQTIAAVWLKLYKVGNPTGNFSPFIYTDTAGSPNALLTNGTATAQSGKLHTADTNGRWYRFVFAVAPSLVGGTQYHIVFKSSAAVDATNYWVVKTVASKKYPFGNYTVGDATPTWTPAVTAAYPFLVELSANAQTIQVINGATFGAKLVGGGSGASGTLSMSRGLCNSVPLHELMDLQRFTMILTGALFTKDCTIVDIGYGEDHDRIVLRCNASTGYAQLDVYDSAGAKTTATGSVDISTSILHTIGIYVRAMNDGADLIDIEVDGVAVSTVNSGIVFDKNFANLGTMWILGGFTLAVTDTQKLTMGALPSTAGWTYTGTATEANAFSVQGGKLFQNKNGYASTDTGYYTKSALSLSNANGWQMRSKQRISSALNTKGSTAFGACFDIYDGTKEAPVNFQEYFMCAYDGAAYTLVPQMDFKSAENVHSIVAKGVDLFHFVNRKLVLDNSGRLLAGTASNQIIFGDESATAGENADVTYSYVAYYNTAWVPPQFTSGYITEFAIFEGDVRSFTRMLYASGTQISMRSMFNLGLRYIDKSAKLPVLTQRGITSAPTATTVATTPEMEAFVIAEAMDISYFSNVFNSGAGNDMISEVAVDGVTATPDSALSYASNATYPLGTQIVNRKVANLGLHKITGRNGAGTGTLTNYVTRRNLVVTPRV